MNFMSLISIAAKFIEAPSNSTFKVPGVGDVKVFPLTKNGFKQGKFQVMAGGKKVDVKLSTQNPNKTFVDGKPTPTAKLMAQGHKIVQVIDTSIGERGTPVGRVDVTAKEFTPYTNVDSPVIK